MLEPASAQAAAQVFSQPAKMAGNLLDVDDVVFVRFDEVRLEGVSGLAHFSAQDRRRADWRLATAVLIIDACASCAVRRSSRRATQGRGSSSSSSSMTIRTTSFWQPRARTAEMPITITSTFLVGAYLLRFQPAESRLGVVSLP